MTFDWTTFLLEIGNFLVLLWLLKRFLYAPVQNAVRQRQSRIEQSLTEAHAVRAEAEALRTRLAEQLADWERQQETARAALHDDIATERVRLMAQVQTALEHEREKAQVLEERHRAAFTASLERQALTVGAAFVSRLLQRFASPALEARVIEMALADLETLDAERCSALQRTLSEATDVSVMSAFALDDPARLAIERAVSRLAGTPLRPLYTTEPELLAGVRITAGPWVLAANLRDELRSFIEVPDDK